MLNVLKDFYRAMSSTLESQTSLHQCLSELRIPQHSQGASQSKQRCETWSFLLLCPSLALAGCCPLRARERRPDLNCQQPAISPLRPEHGCDPAKRQATMTETLNWGLVGKIEKGSPIHGIFLPSKLEKQWNVKSYRVFYWLDCPNYHFARVQMWYKEL